MHHLSQIHPLTISLSKHHRRTKGKAVRIRIPSSVRLNKILQFQTIFIKEPSQSEFPKVGIVAFVLEVLPAQVLRTSGIVPSWLPEPINDVHKRSVVVIQERCLEVRLGQVVCVEVLRKGPIQHGTAFE